MRILRVDARGELCPIPVIKTKKALSQVIDEDIVEVIVDNEIAVQNLSKMATQKKLQYKSEKKDEQTFIIRIEIKNDSIEEQNIANNSEELNSNIELDSNKELNSNIELNNNDVLKDLKQSESTLDIENSYSNKKSDSIVVLGSNKMGEGSDELGEILMKGFIYSLTELEELPKTIIMYNSGVKLSTEGSTSIDDLKTLEAQGVEILSCGTCLNYYNLSEKLKVGDVTNMYVISESMSNANKIIKI